MRPRSSDYALYYDRYVQLVYETEAVDALRHSFETFLDFIENVPESKADHSYEKGKWTVKQVLIHMIDTERIMAYRALRFSRNDTTELAGFDQDHYVLEANLDNRSLESLIEDYKIVRAHTLSLYENFDEKILNRSGVADQARVTVNALAFIIAGHELHHMKILKRKYMS